MIHDNTNNNTDNNNVSHYRAFLGNQNQNEQTRKSAQTEGIMTVIKTKGYKCKQMSISALKMNKY